MVIGDFLLQYSESQFTYFPMSAIWTSELNLTENEIADNFFKQCGLDFSWHVLWNKIYSRDIINKSYSILDKIDNHIVMCEDVLASSVFWLYATKVTNVHNNYYYYNKEESLNQSTKITDSFPTIKKNIDDIVLVFSILEKIYIDIRKKQYVPFIKKWKDRLLNIHKRNAEKICQKDTLDDVYEYINERLSFPEKIYSNNIENFFYMECPYTHFEYESIKKDIIKNDTISFDIFDTLVIRPFLYPTDLFHFLGDFVSKELKVSNILPFQDIRMQAEERARNNLSLCRPFFQEITLDEIYKEIEYLTCIDHDKLQKIKEKEVSLEIQYCTRRYAAQELYELAAYLDKRIYIISDMYLDENTIQIILEKNDYTASHKVFLSSSIRMTKATGDLYRYILSEENCFHCVHIGDNWDSDVIQPRLMGWTSHHLPKPSDMLRGTNGAIYSGKFFSRLYENNLSIINSGAALRFIGIRCMLAIVANKIYDNPFVSFSVDSDFNSNSYFIGYFPLGMYVYGFLSQIIKEERYDSICFLARDGWLFREAFHILYPKKETSYLHLSRKSLLPLYIQNKEDIYTLWNELVIYNNSPQKVLKYLEPILSIPIEQAFILLKKDNILPNKNFSNYKEFLYFLTFFAKNLYSEKNSYLFKQKIKKYLDPFFRGKTATVDVGYSLRAEYLLKKIFGYDVTAYYAHVNDDKSIIRSQYQDIDLHTLLSYEPYVTGAIREHCTSEIGPSCIGYYEKNDSLEPIFGNFAIDYPTYITTKQLHKGCLDFIRSIKSTFSDDYSSLFFQIGDTALPFELFNYAAKDRDRYIFSSASFEDDLGESSKISLKNFWDKQHSFISDNCTCHYQENSVSNFLEKQPRWKKIIYFVLFDRYSLKIKTKKHLETSPYTAKFAKFCYVTLRTLYRKARNIKL